MPRRKATARKRPNFSRNSRPRKRRRFNRPLPGGQQLFSDRVTSLSQSGNAVVPQSMNVKLRYFDDYLGVDTQAVIQNYSANSLYDPLFTLGGHQPMGFDQWAAFYKSYRVNAFKMRITVIMNSTGQHGIANMPSMMLAIWPNYEQSSVAISKNILMELPQRSIGYASGIGGQSIASIEFYTPIHTYFGLTKAEYAAEESYQAAVTADPNIQAVVSAQIEGVGIPGRVADYELHVECTYFATFFEPRTLPQSL